MGPQLYISGNEARVQYHELRPFRTRLHYECVVMYLLMLSREVLINVADDGARGIVEMLFCTSLIALVGVADQPQSSPRKLQIVNTKVRSQVQYASVLSGSPRIL